MATATTKRPASQFLPAILVLAFIIISIFAISASAIGTERWKFRNKIRRINDEGPYIGLITIYPPEENAFFSISVFKHDRRYPYVDLSRRRYRVGWVYDKKVIYVRCGVGMVNAAAVTQQMLDLFNVVGLVHFGISGNANNSMSIGDVTIPKQFANTGLWDWLNPNRTIPSSDVAVFDFGNYNVPVKDEMSPLGSLLSNFIPFPGIELEQCLNTSVCLKEKPKLVVGLKGSTADIFMDNAAYRDFFLFHTFEVTSIDIESSAVLMTSLSNGFPVIVIRGLSDLAGDKMEPTRLVSMVLLQLLTLPKLLFSSLAYYKEVHLKSNDKGQITGPECFFF